ncbi:MAG: hypothetical protein V7765_14320 [Oleispira sp.]
MSADVADGDAAGLDSTLVLVEEYEVGNVLNIGLRSRVIPVAMAVRDDGH